MQPTLLLIRHVATAYNRPPERIRARLDVPPLEKALHDFERPAATLIEGFPPARIYTDETTRCTETAAILARAANYPVPPKVLDGLLSWDNGYIAGRTVKEVVPLLTSYEYYEHRPIPGGEPYAAFKRRSLTALRRLLQEAGKVRGRGAIYAVTHSKNIDLAVAWFRSGMIGIDADTSQGIQGPDVAGNGGAIVWTYDEGAGRWAIFETGGDRPGKAE